MGPAAHKTAGSGFERRTPARRAKAREGFRKRAFEIDIEQYPSAVGIIAAGTRRNADIGLFYDSRHPSFLLPLANGPGIHGPSAAGTAEFSLPGFH
jgi:hypothetical protein